MRTINVRDFDTDLTYLNPKGEVQPLGSIVEEIYGEDEAKRFTYYPDKTNQWAVGNKVDQGYRLGVGSAKMSFINPADAQGSLLEKGYEITDQFAYKGGTQMTTIYKHPDRVYKDPLDYDYDQWNTYGRKGNVVHAGASVTTNLVIGRSAARIQHGLYRTVCENGMVSSLFELPSEAYSHKEGEAARIKDIPETLTDPVNQALSRGVVEHKHLCAATKLLRRFHSESTSKGISSELKLIGHVFTGITGNVLSIGQRQAYIEQLELICDTVSDDITAFHIVNAYTNAINIRRVQAGSDRGAWVAWAKTDDVVSTTISIAKVSAIFS